MKFTMIRRLPFRMSTVALIVMLVIGTLVYMNLRTEAVESIPAPEVSETPTPLPAPETQTETPIVTVEPETVYPEADNEGPETPETRPDGGGPYGPPTTHQPARPTSPPSTSETETETQAPDPSEQENPGGEDNRGPLDGLLDWLTGTGGPDRE